MTPTGPVIVSGDELDLRVAVQTIAATGEIVVCITAADNVQLELSPLSAIHLAIALRDAGLVAAEQLNALADAEPGARLSVVRPPFGGPADAPKPAPTE